MITYSEIGYNGRLGNQLFQFAATLGVGRWLCYDVKFPTENVSNKRNQWLTNNTNVEVCFEVPLAFDIAEHLLSDSIEVEKEVRESQFHYDNRLFNIEDGTSLNGYFQSEKYFKHVEQELRDILLFSPEARQKAYSIFPRVNHETVSIHIRRGDYTTSPDSHPPCTLEYYQKALEHFQEGNYTFLIFSDDIEYAKKIFLGQENVLFFNNDSYTDLCLMSACDHHIIANSSYSWWGAWLGRNINKKVIAPAVWFGPSLMKNNTQDLYCEEWIII